MKDEIHFLSLLSERFLKPALDVYKRQGDANTVMNSMMAESFNKACDALEGAEDFEKAAIDYIYKTMKENKNIVFNGNGYSDEWVEEAAKRGLPNVKSIVDAIPAYTDESSIEMFEKLGVMTKRELEARREIKLEEYAGLINIEARTKMCIRDRWRPDPLCVW